MAVRKGEQNPYAFFYLTQAHYLSGDYEQGRRAAELGLSILPGNTRILSGLFNLYVSQGKLMEARVVLGQWEAKAPGPWTQECRAVLAALEGRPEEATELFSGSENLIPQSRGLDLPLMRLAEGKIGQALELAHGAPDRSLLAYLEYRAGNFAGAVASSEKDLQEALKNGSFSQRARALQMRGLAELAMGSVGGAKKTAIELQACVRQAPIQRLIRHHDFLVGMIERDAGNYPKAVEYLNKAIALLPQESLDHWSAWHPLFFDGLAGAYFKSGDMARAEDTYRKIQSLVLARLDYGDIYATSFYWLGRIAENKGDRAKSRGSYAKFLDLWKNADPGLPEVKDAEKRLAGLTGG